MAAADRVAQAEGRRLGNRTSALNRAEAAALKTELKTGQITPAKALLDPRSGSITVFDLCRAVPSYGLRKVPRFLNRINVRSNLRIRDLTQVQRDRLVRGWLDPKFYAKQHW
jgi:hypothetical protein